MEQSGPITSAVYGRKRGGPTKPKRDRKPAATLIGSQLGEEQVAELYRKLGFKRPNERPRKRKTASQSGRATK